MAKGAEKKKTNLMLNTAQGQSQGFTNNYLSQTSPERDTARQHGNELYGQMTTGYNDLATNKGITPELLAAIRGSGGAGGSGSGGGGGGYTPMNLGGSGVKDSYQNFIKTGGVNMANTNAAMGILGGIARSGGWSPEDRAKQNDIIAQLTEMGKTGGLSPEDINRMRGLGMFDEFAKTGGFNEGQIQDIRSRATSQIPAAYSANKAEMDRMGRVTGQYNPAVAAQMQRQTGYDSSKAALDAELGISDQVRSGRQWGIQGLTSAEQELQKLKTGNQLAGNQAAGGMRGDMLNSIAGNQTNAAGQWGQLDIGSQGLIQQGRMFGTTGQQGLNQAQNAANANAAASRAASNRARIGDEKWLANFAVDNQLAGLGGLGNVYTSNPAELEYYDKMRQGSVNANVANTGNLAGLRIQNNPQTDWGGMVGNIAGAAVGGLTGGFGAGAFKKKAPTGGVSYNQGWQNMASNFPT